MNAITISGITNFQVRQDLSNALQAEKDTHLELGMDIIKYIFVKNSGDKDKVLTLWEVYYITSRIARFFTIQGGSLSSLNSARRFQE